MYQRDKHITVRLVLQVLFIPECVAGNLGFLHRIQNTLQLRSAVGVNIKLITPQMQVINAVCVPTSDLMVQKYHAIWLQ